MIPLTEIVSSTIKAVGYDKGALQVVFHSSPNRIYVYASCDDEDARKLLAAPSAGKFFAQHIKGRPFETVDFNHPYPTPKPKRTTLDPFDWFAAAKAAGVFTAPSIGLIF